MLNLREEMSPNGSVIEKMSTDIGPFVTSVVDIELSNISEPLASHMSFESKPKPCTWHGAEQPKDSQYTWRLE